jgi:hypothetical protein
MAVSRVPASELRVDQSSKGPRVTGADNGGFAGLLRTNTRLAGRSPLSFRYSAHPDCSGRSDKQYNDAIAPAQIHKTNVFIDGKDVHQIIVISDGASSLVFVLAQP